MTKLDITRILSHTKYPLSVRPVDKTVFVVDIDQAADLILQLFEQEKEQQALDELYNEKYRT
jgi:hypothetical protein